MASFNNTLFLGLLVAISAFMAAPSSVEAQLQLLPSGIRINGTVLCTVNATLSSNGTLPPPFANASVLLRCGNTTVANTTTNSAGIFALLLNAPPNIIQVLFSFLPGGTPCRIVIATPLVQCNPALPNVGSLVSNLTSVASTTIGNILGFTTGLFQFLST